MFFLNKILHWIIFMHKLYIDLIFSLKIDSQILNKVLSKYSNIFGFLRIYKLIYEYIRLSKNLRMNIRIYSYWGNGTNTNRNNIRGPFYSNFWIFEYSCSSLSSAEPVKFCLSALEPRAAPLGLGPQGRILLTQLCHAARNIPNPFLLNSLINQIENKLCIIW